MTDEPIDGWHGELVRFVGVTMNGSSRLDDRDDGAQHIAIQLALSPSVDLQRVLTRLGAALTGLDRELQAEHDLGTGQDRT